jgi:smad nuclear-interacting protein 1
MWKVKLIYFYLDTLNISKQSCYLIGKDDRICNIVVNHDSCSRQHAVIQFRKVNNIIRPYIMDLESTNGTSLNKSTIEAARYFELKHYDIVNFGFSTRDYVIIKVDEVEYKSVK